MYDIIIIDPASTEFNRGSFCYLPYILYSALKEEGKEVLLLENATVANIDHIPGAEKYLIALWSYPQIEACEVYNRFMGKNIAFFGYYPLIEKLSLPMEKIDNETIKKGILSYPEYYDDFTYLLLSDCDMHLAKYTGKVYPFCTSYGCPNGCTFCPSTVNCNKQRIFPGITFVLASLVKAYKGGVRNIHFTDEDFFWDTDRTKEILELFAFLNENIDESKHCQLIAMGHIGTVLKFVNKYGIELLEASGLKLIEVGFETADEKLAKDMGKVSVDKYIKLANFFKDSEVNIFWLTLTFFPGETLKTVNKTGDFLRKYGYDLDELYGRIRTNSTEGGLGQFFQWYAGIEETVIIDYGGVKTTNRPIRLIPSYVPNSFLDDTIKCEMKGLHISKRKWFDLYKVEPYGKPTNLNKMKVHQAIEHLHTAYGYTYNDALLYITICARLGIITNT